eukprot:9159453-Alexandrium_andersonii.AAC.1
MLRKSPAAERPTGRPRRSASGRAVSSSSSRSRSHSTKCVAVQTSNLSQSSTRAHPAAQGSPMTFRASR